MKSNCSAPSVDWVESHRSSLASLLAEEYWVGLELVVVWFGAVGNS